MADMQNIRGMGTDTDDFIHALNNAHFGGYSDWRLGGGKNWIPFAIMVDMNLL